MNILHLYARDNLKHSKREPEAKICEVVFIKGNERNKAQWKLGVITEVYPGRDRNGRAVTLRAGKSNLEQAIQHLYPLKLSCVLKHQLKSIG